MTNFLQDLRYAVRMLLKHPVFTVVSIVSLALGIAANTTIFSLVQGILLSALPYPEPDRLVIVWTVPPDHPDWRQAASVSNFLAWRDQQRVFEQIGSMQLQLPFNLSASSDDSSGAERIWGQRFSSGTLEALGVRPVLGRYFTAAEAEVSADPVVVMSHRLWQRRFGGDPAIAGKTIRMDNVPTTVVGVMPPGFEIFNRDADVWVPSRFASFNVQSRSRYLVVIGRLKPGISLPQAQTVMAGIAAGLSQSDPDRNKGWGIKVELLHETYIGWVRRPLLVLQGAVAFVLLIACANVAGLLLAQAVARQKEIAVRSALGAGRWRLSRQFLTESALLAVLGGALGLLLAHGALRAVIALSPPDLPRLANIAINDQVLFFTVALSLFTGLLFGLAPALQAVRADLVDSLKESSRGASGGRVRQRLRSALVVVEMAMALVLLIGAGLMINTFLRLYGADPGCDPRGLLTFRLRLPRAEFVKDIGAISGYHAIDIDPRVGDFYQQVWERLQGVPGVRAVAASNMTPLSGDSIGLEFKVEGRKPAVSAKEALQAGYDPVSPDFFRTMAIPLLRGRDFTPHDNAAAPWVVVINQTLARRYFPNEDPIGKRLTLDLVQEEKPREIIGVVGDLRQSLWQREPQPQMYVPHQQQPARYQGRFAEPRLQMTFVVRAAGDPMRIVPSLRGAVAQIDPNRPIFDVKLVEQYVKEQLQGDRLYMSMLAIFGAVALVLAAIGIYGVMAFSVSQRTHEIGIRMALGAGAGDVRGLVIRQGLLLVSIGMIIGLAGALGLTRLLESELYGVKPTDPVTFASVSAVLIFVALAACYIPARRATKVDPMIALRHE